MPETLAQILDRARPIPPVFVTGKVAAVDEATYSIDVTPDDGGQVIKNVPLRVMRHADSTGVIAVPAVGTEVVVAWLDANRPTVVAVQEWAKLIMLTPEGFGIVVTDIIKLGTEAAATQAAVRGDDLKAYLDADRVWKASHTHGDPPTTGVPTTVGPPPAIPLPVVPATLLSTKVKLE